MAEAAEGLGVGRWREGPRAGSGRHTRHRARTLRGVELVLVATAPSQYADRLSAAQSMSMGPSIEQAGGQTHRRSRAVAWPCQRLLRPPRATVAIVKEPFADTWHTIRLITDHQRHNQPLVTRHAMRSGGRKSGDCPTGWIPLGTNTQPLSTMAGPWT